MIACILGNNPHLSLAEIYALFPDVNVVYFKETLLLIEEVDPDRLREVLPTMGGVIKAINVFSYSHTDLGREIAKFLKENHTEGKLTFGINSFGIKGDNLRLGLQVKKELKKSGISVRCVNKSRENIATPVIKKEKLIANGTDINLLRISDSDGVEYQIIGSALFVQDIDAYNMRDTGKARSMQVGMLPPKLSQMMINISTEGRRDLTLYDPFVGLGTLLIEGVHAGHTDLAGSDLSQEMVTTSGKNVVNYANSIDAQVTTAFFQQDARSIDDINLDLQNTAIATEGTLGDIVGQSRISEEFARNQKSKLLRIYEGFFTGLKNKNFTGNIVISFPFWQSPQKKYYIEEIPELLEKISFKIQPLLPEEYSNLTSKRGSLPYIRKDQTVGREIYKMI